MEAFMAATAAARDLAAAISTAQIFGIVLAVGIGDGLVSVGAPTDIRVYVIDSDGAADGDPADEAERMALSQ